MIESNYMTGGSAGRVTVPVDEPPLLVEQTSWPFGYIDFGKAKFPNMSYFNAGFVARPDGDWLVARRSIAIVGRKFGMNDLVAFLMHDKNLMHGLKIKIPESASGEQFEDPRVVFHKGKTYVSCCNFVHHGATWTGAHQILAECDDQWKVLKRWDIPYGGNGGALGDNTRNEKNWVWWFRNDKPHLIYLASPHTVAQFTPEFELESEYKTHADLSWHWGEIRGGTPPVLAGKQYYTFFHSSIPWPQGAPRRRYVLGAYAFESKPPFKITAITQRPLLTGTIRERWMPGNPPCVFACGCELRAKTFMLTMGINDLHTAWLDIPYDHLIPLMRPIV